MSTHERIVERIVFHQNYRCLMGPVFEQLLVTPQQIVQVSCVEVSESTPENDEMTRSNSTDRIKLETT